jgi:hypothetical protein
MGFIFPIALGLGTNGLSGPERGEKPLKYLVI